VEGFDYLDFSDFLLPTISGNCKHKL